MPPTKAPMRSDRAFAPAHARCQYTCQQFGRNRLCHIQRQIEQQEHCIAADPMLGCTP
jgi:hypothetical protein